ncbi:restriction endonuclease subunit S [Methylococcaceae bacterium WWC4]|nr:restriction endonuclease subunit S [Methylococcaceae bacterium WWC4]
MSFPRYESYKDSGVEWLGEVPEHWELRRLKHNLRLLTEKTDRRENPVALENIESWSGRFIPTETTFEGEGVAFEGGDILFGKLRPYLAKAYLAEGSGEAVGDFHVLRPTTTTQSRFSQYQILNREFIAIVDGSTFGAKMPRVSWDFLGNMVLSAPPVPEQQTIAAFLDRETAKIDALIAEQQRLIELLKEKRQAVISHAVTKGLNPNAPMKDSGIEWLGEVPAHWGLSKLKHAISKIIDNRGRTPEFGDEGIPMLEVKQITEGTRYPTNSFEKFVKPQIVEQFERDKVLDGDVLLTTVGATAGKAVIVDKNPDYFIAQNVIGLRSVTNVYNIFLYYTIISDYFFHSLFSINKSNTIDNLKVSVFINNFCLVPPIEEQFEIAVFIDNELVKLDALTAEAKNGIELLKERRTALISAAVTGKIDVRGFVLSEYQ